MLLTISTTHNQTHPTRFLLHKNPSRIQSFHLSFGNAHVFYPEISNEKCTIALLVDVDTVHLVRGGEGSFSLDQYVNDRPYVTSSFLSVAIADVFRSALNGLCSARPELVDELIPLQATLAVVPCRKGEAFLKQLFEPLGYKVTAQNHLLDKLHPEWGMSYYYTLTLEANCRLRDLLTHLYVIVPVLDNNKHYWIGDDEVEKLLRRGKGWLETHPEREQITYRYLKHRQSLVRDALARLIIKEAPDLETDEPEEEGSTTKEVVVDEGLRLHDQRLRAVLAAIQQSGARRVLDLGCGEGRLLRLLLQDKNIEKIIGFDVSYRALEIAKQRLHIDRLPPRQKDRIQFIHGALTYRDRRLEGFDAAAVVEVIEHLDPARLAAFERVLFEFARPSAVVITTPNAEYNVKFESLHAGNFRHKDHRFEWTRSEFQTWADKVSQRFNYSVQTMPVGPEDPTVGAPSQMAIFSIK